MQVNFAFWSRESVAPDPHRPSKRIVGLLGTGIVRAGIGTGESRWRELFQIIRTLGGNAMLQSDATAAVRTEELQFTRERNLAGSNQFGLQLVCLSLTE